MKQSDLTPIPIDAATSPSTAWKEVVEPDEHALFEGIAREIEAKQKEVAQQTGGPLRRGFHAKLHAGLIAEFQVLADLPAYARFGVSLSVSRGFSQRRSGSPTALRGHSPEPTRLPL
jgi:hypothetical protein